MNTRIGDILYYPTYDFVIPVTVIELNDSMFVWVDEGIGHSMEVGYEIFTTINEAIKYIVPSNKRNLKRRLKKWRELRQNFILATQNTQCGKYHHRQESRVLRKRIFNLKNKKIYVRKK